MPQFERDGIGADRIRLEVDDVSLDGSSGSIGAYLEAIKNAGDEGLLVCGCDGLLAVELSQSLRGTREQGTHVRVLKSLRNQLLCRALRMPQPGWLFFGVVQPLDLFKESMHSSAERRSLFLVR